MLKHATISAMPPKTLKRLAHDFETEARALRLEAAERIARLRMRRANDRHIAHLRSSAGMVQAYLDRGYGLDGALVAVAPAFGCPVPTIETHWLQYLRDLKLLARLRRDLKIIGGARAGKTNAAIAESLAPPRHPNSVSRILRRLLDAGSGLRQQRREMELHAQQLSDGFRAIDEMKKQATDAAPSFAEASAGKKAAPLKAAAE